MKSIQEIRQEYIDLINSDIEGNRAGALALKANMERSPMYFRDRFCSQNVHIPRMYSEEMIEQFKEIVRTTYSIFENETWQETGFSSSSSSSLVTMSAEERAEIAATTVSSGRSHDFIISGK